MFQNSGMGVTIHGIGSAVPKASLNNHQISQIVDTSDEWITTRTGIGRRRLAEGTSALTGIATEAAQKAINMANIDPVDIDLIILATSSPDDLFGSASQVQARLGAKRAAAFDLTAACSGFVFGMVTAAQFIRTGAYQTIVLIGADVLSRWVDWSDRRTCVLFGDGAGAIVMQTDQRDHLLGFELRSDGTQHNSLTLAYQGQTKSLLDGIAVNQGTYQHIVMNGRDVYKFVVKQVPEIIEKALFRATLTIDQVDWLILHQANQRILDGVAQRLNIPEHKVVSNLANYGNTSAASIPLTLDEIVRQGKVKSGDTIAISGFGAGLTWGAAVFRW
ncbi:MAG: beta-ketoacyl-ACP synthase III [Leptolyngbyaceae cyanobacterium]